MEAHFIVHGTPVGKQRPRFAKRGNFVKAYTPDKTIVYENLIKCEYERQCPGIHFEAGIPLEVVIIAKFAPPTSISKKKIAQMLSGEILHTKTPDADNVGKIVCDSLHDVCYPNDSAVAKLIITKIYASEPMLDVTVREIVGANSPK